MKAEMKKVKGKAGQGNTFWDSYQRIAVEQGVRSQNRTRRVCLYECITYLLFFYQLPSRRCGNIEDVTEEDILQQHLQPVKERFFSSRPRKSFRSQS